MGPVLAVGWVVFLALVAAVWRSPGPWWGRLLLGWFVWGFGAVTVRETIHWWRWRRKGDSDGLD